MTQVSLRDGRQQSTPCGKEEMRCMKRSDLMETLAYELPPGTIRFNCRAIGVEISPSSDSILHLDDGTTIRSRVVVGCEGVSSIIAKALGMEAPRIDSRIGIRGLTTYAGDGHNFENQNFLFRTDKIVFGRLPINHNLVYWFMSPIRVPQDSDNSKDPVLIKKLALETINDFPEGIIEMVKQSDPISLSLTRFRFRPPWELMRKSWHKGTVTLAGDAMHAMGPYLGQGCSLGLEDSIVLSRCIGSAMRKARKENDRQTREAISSAIEKYVKERKMRVLRMSSQTYLSGLLVKPISPVLKLAIQVVLFVLFGKQFSHAQYDCGTLLAIL
ncbi:zeaxanthin epoxidase, chloroplastic [Amborella trichopoda]|nr:zeaxanthin epoxidase, chloroplastic [Amborella trichopoda]|eukprot:XP_006836914.2 zeaxanthin epoxidase, chloroplastic [Amborella trichopoda]